MAGDITAATFLSAFRARRVSVPSGRTRLLRALPRPDRESVELTNPSAKRR